MWNVWVLVLLQCECVWASNQMYCFQWAPRRSCVTFYTFIYWLPTNTVPWKKAYETCQEPIPVHSLFHFIPLTNNFKHCVCTTWPQSSSTQSRTHIYSLIFLLHTSNGQPPWTPDKEPSILLSREHWFPLAFSLPEDYWLRFPWCQAWETGIIAFFDDDIGWFLSDNWFGWIKN